VAQAVGARDEPAVARGIQRGIILSLAITLPTVLAYLPAEHVLRFLGQPTDVVPRAADFVHFSIPGIPAFFGFVVMRQSLQAMGRMRPIVTVILGANVLNAVLAWLLVYGHLGPIRGAAGVAVASVIARWSMMGGLLFLAWREVKPALVPYRREALSWRPLIRMIALGAPIGMQYLLEFGVFAVVALLMGRLGTVQVAAHQIAINIASLTFMVPLGISSAASVLVGRAVGAGNADQARRAALASLGCGVVFMLASGLVLGAWPRPLAQIYSGDAPVVALAAGGVHRHPARRGRHAHAHDRQRARLLAGGFPGEPVARLQGRRRRGRPVVGTGRGARGGGRLPGGPGARADVGRHPEAGDRGGGPGMTDRLFCKIAATVPRGIEPGAWS
jgi:MATE family multidrug resistance protein